MDRVTAALLLLLGLLVAAGNTEAGCTIGVVSGRATEDGRAVLWKNRDVAAQHNSVIFFPATGSGPVSALVWGRRTSPGGHIALVSTFGQTETKAWTGVNEAGFAILNSVIAGPSGYNGVFMKRALESCTSLEEFERLLDEWDQGGLAANFGVIDAHGGAAIFEVIANSGEPPEYHRFDADDAEEGFLVRTNFSSTWGGAAGIEQYERARELLGEARRGGRLDHLFVLREAARDVDGEIYPGHEERDTRFAISRYVTRSASVIHGVAPGWDPAATTFWVILGEPSCGIAVPLWAAAHEVPSLLHSPGEIAPLNALTIEKEQLCYPNVHRPIMNTTRLFLDWEEHQAVFDYSLPAEKILWNEVSRFVPAIIRRDGFSPPAVPVAKKLAELQARAAAYAYDCLATEQARDWISRETDLIPSGLGAATERPASRAGFVEPPAFVLDSGE